MYKSNFRKALAEYEQKYGKLFKINCALRRFKRNHLTSKKKKAAKIKAIHDELHKTFTVEPHTYYEDQPN